MSEAHEFRSLCICWTFLMQARVCAGSLSERGAEQTPCALRSSWCVQNNFTGIAAGMARDLQGTEMLTLEIISPKFSLRVGLSPPIDQPYLCRLPELWRLVKVEIPQPLPEHGIGNLFQCSTTLLVNSFSFSGATWTSQASIYCPLYVTVQFVFAAFVIVEAMAKVLKKNPKPLII